MPLPGRYVQLAKRHALAGRWPAGQFRSRLFLSLYALLTVLIAGGAYPASAVSESTAALGPIQVASGNSHVVEPAVSAPAPAPRSADARQAVSLPDQLSESDWLGIRDAYEADRYRVKPVSGQNGLWHARNPGQVWGVEFDGSGFLVKPDVGGWTWGLELIRYGVERGEKREVTGRSKVRTGAGRVVYDWGAGLEEWFINDRRGLEHGYTISERPAGGSGPLAVEMKVRGGLAPVSVGSGQGVGFVDDNGVGVVNYTGLKVFDADGKTIPARLEVAGAGLRLLVADSEARYPLTIDPIAQQAYLKASNTGSGDQFGSSIAMSGDTVVVGAPWEASCATGVDGDQASNSCSNAGAAYVFVRSAGVWSQEAYLKASNTGSGDQFGWSVAVSGDTVLVAANIEASCATGVDGDQANNSCANSGAVYVFVRNVGVWSQEAYLKASNTALFDQFGYSVGISGDTAVVGAYSEASCAAGVDGDQANNGCYFSGAAYVFVRNVGAWSQEAYLKASNTGTNDSFGQSVAISDDTAVVGARLEASCATGVGGSQTNNSCNNAGAAYVFVRNVGTWSQQAYLKASNTAANDYFGQSVAISEDTVVIGAGGEASCATGVDGDQANNSCNESGAAYVFLRNTGAWSQQAYLKASNTDGGDFFGISVAVTGDSLGVGAYYEKSCAVGVDGDQTSNACYFSGAVYMFVRSAGVWSPQAYLKASNSQYGDNFGTSIAMSGGTAAVGAPWEASCATGVNGDQANNSCGAPGAAYVYDLNPPDSSECPSSICRPGSWRVILQTPGL